MDEKGAFLDIKSSKNAGLCIVFALPKRHPKNEIEKKKDFQHLTNVSDLGPHATDGTLTNRHPECGFLGSQKSFLKMTLLRGIGFQCVSSCVIGNLFQDLTRAWHKLQLLK